MAISPARDVVVSVDEAPSHRWWAGIRDFIRQRPLGAVGAAVVAIMVVVAIFAGVLAPYDPVAQDVIARSTRRARPPAPPEQV